MERYLKDAEPQLKPEPVEDHILDFDSGWINTEFEEDFGPIKHELIIKSEPSDQDDTDDDRLSLDDLNIWDRGLCNRTEDSYSSPGQLSSSSSSSSIHSLDGDTPPFSPVVKLENNNVVNPADSRAGDQLTVKITEPSGAPSSPPQPLTPPSSPESGGSATTPARLFFARNLYFRKCNIFATKYPPRPGIIPIPTLANSNYIAGASSLKSFPTGLVRVTGPNGTRSAIIRVTARGGKMIPRLISFTPSSMALKGSLSDTNLRLDSSVNDEKRRIHKCSFPNCKKVYTKSSHLKAHQRTHTGTNDI